MKTFTAFIILIVALTFLFSNNKEAKAWEPDKMPTVISCKLDGTVISYGAECENWGGGCVPNPCDTQE